MVATLEEIELTFPPTEPTQIDECVPGTLYKASH